MELVIVMSGFSSVRSEMLSSIYKFSLCHLVITCLLANRDLRSEFI